jgi:acylglycerol lipase
MTLLRVLASVILAAALAACAPTIAPPGTNARAPSLTDSAFLTADGLSLPLRRWLPDGQLTAVVVALHGFNDYAKAFDKVPESAIGTGSFLSGRGVAVYAYDQRGFGRSPHAGFWPGQAALTGDVRDIVALLRGRHPGIPIYGLGESMGGAVLMSAAAEATTPFLDGLILAAPAVWARATMPLPYRIALWLGARLTPGLKPTGRGFGVQATDNIALLRHNARDPLFIKTTRIDAIDGVTSLMDAALASPPKLNLPTLYLYGQNDQLIPKQPTLMALQSFPAEAGPLRLAYYPKGWHIVLRDKQAETVLNDVAAFIDDPQAPLPSGADQEAKERLTATLKSKPAKSRPAKPMP